MRMLEEMVITAKKSDTLEALRTNRAAHKKIVEEARAGYLERAKAALDAKLELLRSGKLVSLVFGLSPPQDYTKVYDTAIRMLELHQEDTIVLNSSQVRNLMMDEWDWKDHFLASNAPYSGTAALARGTSADED